MCVCVSVVVVVVYLVFIIINIVHFCLNSRWEITLTGSFYKYYIQSDHPYKWHWVNAHSSASNVGYCLMIYIRNALTVTVKFKSWTKLFVFPIAQITPNYSPYGYRNIVDWSLGVATNLGEAKFLIQTCLTLLKIDLMSQELGKYTTRKPPSFVRGGLIIWHRM